PGGAGRRARARRDRRPRERRGRPHARGDRPAHGRGQGLAMLRAFLSAPSGLAGLIVLGIILAGAIIAPATLMDLATKLDLRSASQQPSAAHLPGPDTLRRDLPARP